MQLPHTGSARAECGVRHTLHVTRRIASHRNSLLICCVLHTGFVLVSITRALTYQFPVPYRPPHMPLAVTAALRPRIQRERLRRGSNYQTINGCCHRTLTEPERSRDQSRQALVAA